MKKNQVHYQYDKINYFIKDLHFNNMMKKNKSILY